MKRGRLEAIGWTGALVALAWFVVAEGRVRSDLERRVPVSARELYRALARSRTAWQVVDVREHLEEEYEDARIPGALPMPGCDLARAPEGARERVLPTAPTVIVTADGTAEGLDRCAAFFTSARILAGGMEAWSEARLPEDSGEYAPPPVKAGGGCL